MFRTLLPIPLAHSSDRIRFRQDIVIYTNKKILGESIYSYEKIQLGSR